MRGTVTRWIDEGAAPKDRPSAFATKGVEVFVGDDGDAVLKTRIAAVRIGRLFVPRLAVHLLNVWGGEIPVEALTSDAECQRRFIEGVRKFLKLAREEFPEGTDNRKACDNVIANAAAVLGEPEPEPIEEVAPAASESEDDSSPCPVGDPECLSNDDECHDACEAPTAAETPA